MSEILYISQFFSTEEEPGGQGQRHFKHAKALAEDGHQVTVLTTGGTTMSASTTAPPVTPDAKTKRSSLDRKSSWVHPNLRIIKIPTPPMNRRCVVSRALRYFHFSIAALLQGVSLVLKHRQSYQFVLGSSPPLLIGLVAYVIAVLARAEFHLEVRDLWSQTMAANGFISSPWLLTLNRAIESFLYRQSKKIIVLSKAFEAEIETQVPGSAEKTVFIPNGADMEFYEYPKLWRGSYFKHELVNDTFNVIYAGVFSDYTKLETVLDVAEILKATHPQIRFNLAGGGYQLQSIRESVALRGLTNVKIWNALPKNRVTKFIMEGDLSLINYRALDIFAQVLPNKLFEYLAAGRPILACAPEGEVTKILAESNSGRSVAAEDVLAMAREVVWFYENRETGTQMGLQGQQYVRRHFNRVKLTERFLDLYPRVISIETVRSDQKMLAETSDNIIPFPSAGRSS